MINNQNVNKNIFVFIIFRVNEVWVKVLKRLLVFEPQDFRVSISILKYTYSKHNFNKEVW